MMTRTPLSPGRSRYTVRRPQWPSTVVSELTYVLVTSVGGAGCIALGLRYLGLV